MIKSLKRGLIRAIDNEFELPISIDESEQNTDAPCFMIKTLTNTENHVVLTRNKRNHSFMIQYIPKDDDCSDECEEVAERLLNVIRVIPFNDGYIRNKGEIDIHVVDGVLNVEVQYEFFIHRDNRINPVELETFEEVEINQNVKEI